MTDTDSERPVTIGSIFYQVRKDGEIVKLVVVSLPFIPVPSFCATADEALADAIALLEDILAKGVDSKSEEHELRERLETYRVGWLSEEMPLYPIVYGTHVPGRLTPLYNFSLDQLGPIHEQTLPDPRTVILPGTTVWLPVTPGTHNMVVGGFRPKWYFVLKTSVRSARWFPATEKASGRLHYRLNSKYTEWNGGNFFGTEAEAVARLCSFIEADMPAKALPEQVTVFTEADEALHEKVMIDRIVAQHPVEEAEL